MHLKSLRNLAYSFIILGLLVLGGLSNANANDELVGQENIEETGPNIPADEEHHNTKDLEKLLKRYNTDANKVLEDHSKLIKDEDALTTEVNDADLEEMRPSDEPIVKKKKESLGLKNSLKTSDNPNMSQSVALALQPLQKLSEKDLLKLLDDSTKESTLRPYMDKFPHFTVFVVKLIKDKESIPSLVKIVEDRERLIRFCGFMIATFIFGFILKKIMHREGRSFIKAAFYFLFRSFLMFGIRVYIIFYFFSTELTPAARIFNQTLLKDFFN